MSNELFLREKMLESYLIQRIDKPFNAPNPFAFGGGLSDGGFSSDAMKILKTIYRFDYMGSSEFEWGAVPAAFQFLAKQSHAKKVVSGKVGDVYYIAPKQYEEEIKKRIEKLKVNERDFRLKEYCGLSDALNQTEKRFHEPVGWIELDNGFMFFIDEEMFNNSCQLFGIKTK
jgi:hypothetical protein